MKYTLTNLGNITYSLVTKKSHAGKCAHCLKLFRLGDRILTHDNTGLSFCSAECLLNELNKLNYEENGE